MTAPAAERRGPLRGTFWVWLALCLYAVVATVTVARHEMWRDEMHAWQAVVSSESLVELAANVRAEGHPGLWFAVLYPLSRATSDPGAMQLVHLAIAIAVAAVVLLAAPLPIGWRVLFVLGYFPLYEYCAISRNYAVGALLLFAFCALYGARTRRPLLLAAVLFLLAQASAIALILSFSLGLMCIVDARSSRLASPIRPGPAVAALAVWLVGMAVSVVQLAGAREVLQSFDHSQTLAQSRVLDVLSGPWRGCVPLPRLHLAFWNTNILDGVANADVFQAVLGVVVLLVLGSLFVRCGPAFALFAAGSLGMVAFSLLIYRGQLRHQGHFVLLLMAALWLSRVLQPGAGGRGRAAGTAGGTPPWRVVVVSVLLAANAAAGAYAVAREWRDPFSAAREVADFIREQGLAGSAIVGHRGFQVSAVAGYLERPIHYPSVGQEATFLPWKVGWRHPVDDAEALRQARALAQERRSEVLVILSMSGARRPDRIDGATRWRVFRRSIVPSERFELYLVPRPEPAAPLSGAAPDPGPVPRG